MTVSTTPISIMPTCTTTTGTARRSIARSSPGRGSSRPVRDPEVIGSGGDSGAVGVLGGARICQQALGEVDSLGQLGDLPAELIQLVEHLGRDATAGEGLLGIPAPDQTTLDVPEGAAGHQDQVVEVPQPDPADGERHQHAGAGLPDVEAMASERSE